MFMLVGVAAYRQIAVADLFVGIDFYSQIATNQPIFNTYIKNIIWCMAAGRLMAL